MRNKLEPFSPKPSLDVTASTAACRADRMDDCPIEHVLDALTLDCRTLDVLECANLARECRAVLRGHRVVRGFSEIGLRADEEQDRVL
jgi:hypothetical protein